MERTERRTLFALAAVTVVLRFLAYFRYRFDSDEPQHLHVAWGWTKGLVQYRDLFDNHAPLFHMLSAPLLRLAGERDDILRVMRAPMVPLFLIVVLATWMIAQRWWSERIAAWSVILLCTFAPFFLKSLEYRTDNLWTAVWMIALVTLVIWERPFLAGVILGIALCVSLKTMLFVISLGAAAIVTAFVRDERVDIRKALRIAAGFVIAPAVICAYFASIGAWPNLVFCVIRFNELVTRTRAETLIPRMLYPFMLAFVIWRARDIARTHDTPRPRFFLGVCAAMFTITLVGFWLLISPRDFLPVMPLFAIALTTTIIRRAPRASFAILTTLAVLFLGFTAYYAEWFRDRQLEETTMIHQVLALSRPGEPLMDYKGETIYRRRPYYFIFEKIGRGALSSGALSDTVAEAVVREKCHVAQADGAFWPPHARTFLSENFLDMGRLRAAGQWIHIDGSFSIAIEGVYAIVDKDGNATGTLDGMPYTGPRPLAIGSHYFVSDRGERLAVLWAPAFERGFSPFHLKDREF